MRIGIIRYRYTPFGGAEVFLKRLIEGLLEKGHIVEVFSSNWEGGGGGSIRVHKIRATGPRFLRPITFARNVEKAVNSVKPDIVLSLERTYCQDIYRAGDGVHKEWLMKRRGVSTPLKSFLVTLNPLHSALLYLERRLFSSPRLKKVIANSRMVKDDIIRHYGLPEDKICVIYNGVNLKEFSPSGRSVRMEARRALGIGEGDFVILFVGSGFERKGLKYLIRALKPLKEKGGKARLLVVGKGRPGRYLEEAARQGVRDGVIFTGPARDTLRYYAASDIFALTSVYEPFSNACLEAMAMGLPVVTTRANGASELLTEGVNGSIVEDPTDHEEIAGRISPFFDAKKRDEAGRAARLSAEGFPIEKSVDSILRLMDEAAG